MDRHLDTKFIYSRLFYNYKLIAIIICFIIPFSVISQNIPITGHGTIGINTVAIGWSNTSLGGGTPDLSTTHTCIFPPNEWDTSPTNTASIILPVPPTGADTFADVYTAHAGYIEMISTNITNLSVGYKYVLKAYLLTAVSRDATLIPGIFEPIYFPSSVDVTIGGNITVVQLDSTTHNKWKLFTFCFVANAATEVFQIGNPEPHNPLPLGNGGGLVCISIGDNAINPYTDHVNLGADTTLCTGEQLILNPSGLFTEYLWQDSSTNSNYIVTSPGSYSVIASIPGCSSSDTINVYYNPLPDIHLGKDTTLCLGKTLQLDATISGASYQWHDNSTNPVYIANNEGTYWVKVIVDGCMNADTIIVNFKDCNCSLSIPNAITPNGDGINDKWVISYQACYQRINVFVYNRYGSLVYQKNNYKNEWGGTYGSKSLPDGTYYYVIRAMSFTNYEKVLLGNITLLR